MNGKILTFDEAGIHEVIGGIRKNHDERVEDGRRKYGDGTALMPYTTAVFGHAHAGKSTFCRTAIRQLHKEGYNFDVLTTNVTSVRDIKRDSELKGHYGDLRRNEGYLFFDIGYNVVNPANIPSDVTMFSGEIAKELTGRETDCNVFIYNPDLMRSYAPDFTRLLEELRDGRLPPSSPLLDGFLHRFNVIIANPNSSPVGKC
jgi:hypothetical protein